MINKASRAIVVDYLARVTRTTKSNVIADCARMACTTWKTINRERMLCMKSARMDLRRCDGLPINDEFQRQFRGRGESHAYRGGGGCGDEASALVFANFSEQSIAGFREVMDSVGTLQELNGKKWE